METYRNDETYEIIGICMEVHRNLGSGLLEIIYKDAIEIELKAKNIPFEREKEFPIEYKGQILPHRFYADFVVNGNIILEIKAVKEFSKEHLAQLLNYMKISGSELGLLFNFLSKFITIQKIYFMIL